MTKSNDTQETDIEKVKRYLVAMKKAISDEISSDSENGTLWGAIKMCDETLLFINGLHTKKENINTNIIQGPWQRRNA